MLNLNLKSDCVCYVIFQLDFSAISRSQMNLMLNDIQIYLEFLNELCSTGTPIRQILVDCMISNEFYEKKIHSETKKTLVSSTNGLTDYDSNNKAEENFDDLTGILFFNVTFNFIIYEIKLKNNLFGLNLYFDLQCINKLF